MLGEIVEPGGIDNTIEASIKHFMIKSETLNQQEMQILLGADRCAHIKFVEHIP